MTLCLETKICNTLHLSIYVSVNQFTYLLFPIYLSTEQCIQIIILVEVSIKLQLDTVLVFHIFFLVLIVRKDNFSIFISTTRDKTFLFIITSKKFTSIHLKNLFPKEPYFQISTAVISVVLLRHLF